MEAVRRLRPRKDLRWARTIAYYQVLSYRQKRAHQSELVDAKFMELVANEVAALSEELDAAQRALKDCFDKLPNAEARTADPLLLEERDDPGHRGHLGPELRRHAAGPGPRADGAAALCSTRRCARSRAVTDFRWDDADPLQREVYELADALLHRTIIADRTRRLGELVRSNPDARRHYVRFMHDSAKLCQWSAAWEKDKNDECGMMNDELSERVSIRHAAPPTDHSSFIIHHSSFIIHHLSAFTRSPRWSWWRPSRPPGRGGGRHDRGLAGNISPTAQSARAVQRATQPSPYVARITKTTGCRRDTKSAAADGEFSA